MGSCLLAAFLLVKGGFMAKVELLAPAGNLEAFYGAINAGADAVYLGGDKYGARAYADNFGTEELVSCIRYAHLFGRKVYMTVNTLMTQEELDELVAYITPFYEAGLDAVIVQDFGAFEVMKEAFPQMELHASTQMTITGPYGTALLKEMGATRIVPAREMSLAEIRKMKEETGLEIETFIHGAMCYCYSGQCLFSSVLGGRSGNRGRCAQPCRLPYSVVTDKAETDECYPLSLKDMCTIEHIGELIDAGIDSFKIEGRMKKPEYAAGVTSIYRKYIDRKLRNPDKAISFDCVDLDNLSKLYIRSERQDGYYYKQNGKDMITLDSPAYSGSDEAVLDTIRRLYLSGKKKRSVSVIGTFIQGENASVTLACESGESITVYGRCVEKAAKNPITEENIEKQLRKLGESNFYLTDISVFTDGESFYSLKEINELRREAVLQLEDLIIAGNGFAVRREALTPDAKSHEQKTSEIEEVKDGYSILVSDKKQLAIVMREIQTLDMPLSHIYVESDLLFEDIALPEDVTIYAALPFVQRIKDEASIDSVLSKCKEQGICGVLVRNIETYYYLIRKGYNGKIICDAGIYVWNDASYAFWENRGVDVTCPYELREAKWQSLFAQKTIEKCVYGHIPMMITANCIARTTSGCVKGNETSICFLKDRYAKRLPVELRCKYCYNVIYNSVPLSLHKEANRKMRGMCKRISFTTESAQKTQEILRFWEKVASMENMTPPYEEYTTGHEKQGVQ